MSIEIPTDEQLSEVPEESNANKPEFFISETDSVSEDAEGAELFASISADVKADKKQADQEGARILADIKESYVKPDVFISETNNDEARFKKGPDSGKVFMGEEPAKKTWRDKFKQMFKI